MALTQPLDRLKKSQTRYVGGKRLPPFLTEPADFVSGRSRNELAATQSGQLIAIPPLKRSPAVMDLAEVIGQSETDTIQQLGQIVFHAAGDTGTGLHEDLGQVVQVMAMDFERPNPADHPAFFLHLGDVTYNLVFGQVESKLGMYQPQFYTPYSHYPGKILALAGNHDSNPQEDPNSIDAFETNFCAPLPASQTALAEIISSPTRTPMYQPGVYYRLDAPFVQILVLFSNGGESEGVIRGGVVGSDQWNFLVAQLKEIKAARGKNTPRKALIVAVHHPPFSGGGGHSGSGQMLQDLDEAFRGAGVQPDVIVSGHAHNYQRFTRTVNANGTTMQIPYIVAGCGGHNIQPLKPTPIRTPVTTPLAGKPVPKVAGDTSLRQYFNGFGHLMITVTTQIVTIDLIGTKRQSELPFDSVTLDLATNTITSETPPQTHPAVGEQ